MSGCGKCSECIHLYTEYGNYECWKDAFVDKFGDGEWNVDITAHCDYYETYPQDYIRRDEDV